MRTFIIQKTTVIYSHRLMLCAFSKHFEDALIDTANAGQVNLSVDSMVTKVTG